MPPVRDYFDGCAAAHALDLVGERWALLIVRELVLGPKRFTDLRAGLPGVSPNVLAQRLRELDRLGVLRHRRLPPPAASAVYELTPWGRELGPVLRDLARWGVRSPWMPRGCSIGVDSFVLAMRTMFDPAAAAGYTAAYELRLDVHVFRAAVTAEAFDAVRGAAESPDAVVTGAVDALAGVVFWGRSLGDAVRSGDLTVDGDLEAVERLVTFFPLPEPAEAPEPTP